MANEIYDSTWWGNTIDTASSIGTSTEMIQGQFNLTKLGDEISNDVNFDNPSNWSLTGQSTVSNGVAHILQDNSSNTGVTSNTTIINKTYKITGVVSDYVSGSVGFASIGSTSPRKAIPSKNGEFTIYYTSTRSTPSTWNIQRITSPCNLKIDNVSVKEVRAITVEASKCLADTIHRIGLQDIQN